jgi:acyl carrier protein
MTDEIRQFLFESLTEMQYSTDEIGDDTILGPAGVDLDSLAVAELAMRVEDRFGVRFSDDESGTFAVMTISEFCVAVAGRTRTSSPAT